MSPRRMFIAGGAALMAVAGAGYAVLSGDDAGAGTGGSEVRTSTAEVAQTTLVNTEEFNGTLGYGSATGVGGGQGTVTRLPAEGTVVERGETLYEVDGHNVPLLYGSRPAWRPFAEGMSNGLDVKQLEENLVALGHATRAQLGVDQTFNAATTAAVKKLQAATGLDQDGTLGLGEVVFLDGAVRIADHSGSVGGPAGGNVVSVTSASKVVTFDLEADRQDLVAVGDAVELELPSGARVPAKVTSISSVAQSAEGGMGGPATVEVVVTPDDPAATGGLDGAPVDVLITRGQAEDVLAVPVSALLALSEGGYAVEVEAADGRRSLVGVRTGMFADGLVEVEGDGLSAGMSVVVPS